MDGAAAFRAEGATVKTPSQSGLKLLFLSAALLAATAARAQPVRCWDERMEEPLLGVCTQVIHYGPYQDEFAYQPLSLTEADDLAGGGSGEPGVDRPFDQERPDLNLSTSP
jgi:hypothetical protein